MSPAPSDEAVIAATRRWLERAVIGLDLCPFARPVLAQDRIRFCVSAATDAESLLQDLTHELQALQAADPARCETTLLIHPQAMAEFLDYNDFLEIADAAIEALGLEGELQVASFHPRYQFAGTGEDDIDNFSNRSPFPTLHLLRESSVERALEAYPEAGRIYEKNIATLRRLGHPGWRKLWTDDA